MGGTIDDEVKNEGDAWWDYRPISHAPSYAAVDETTVVAVSDTNEEKMAKFSDRYGIEPAHRYTNYREMIESEGI